MATYMKRPIVVEAVRITDQNQGTILNLSMMDKSPISLFCKTIGDSITNSIAWIEVLTLEGVMRGEVGDWLIRGINGEYYPCKPDIFEKTYQEVCQKCNLPREDDSPELPKNGWKCGDCRHENR